MEHKMETIKVMIVDDEADFAETLAERLEMRDFEVRLAGGAEGAMSLLQAGWEPEVILLDLKMPGPDGLETLSLIKEHNPAIEVILVTGHGSTSSGMEGMHKGVIVERIREAAKKKAAS
jgi:DNA-binding NtrC family response regulator